MIDIVEKWDLLQVYHYISMISRTPKLGTGDIGIDTNTKVIQFQNNLCITREAVPL